MSDERRAAIYADITDERWRQISKWGPQTHPDGTGQMRAKVNRAVYTARNDHREANGESGIWSDILLEEVFEAMSETDPAALRKELIQSAAVIVAWLEDVDGRAGPDARP